jgi:hypothetical protein
MTYGTTGSGPLDEESLPLQRHEEGNSGDAAAFPENEARRTFSANKAMIILICALVAAFALAGMNSVGYNVDQVAMNFGLIKANPKPSIKPTKVVKAIFSKPENVFYATKEDMQLTASNEYGQFEAEYPWLNDVEGTQLVEPYKDTTLEITGAYVDSGLYKFLWSLTDFPGSFEDGPSTQVVSLCLKHFVDLI